MALLEINGLKAYYGQTQALYGLDFSLEEGSITTILGANGAGKTITLRSICRMIHTEGDIKFPKGEAPLYDSQLKITCS